MGVTRLVVLRSGYGALGLAFLALAAGYVVDSLVILGLVIALVGGVLLAFSDDDLPKWAGITIVVYFVVTVLAFLAASGMTIKVGEQRFFWNDSPAAAAEQVMTWFFLVSPLMLGAAAIVASWERENAARILLFGAVGGFILVAVLSVILVPSGTGSTAAASAQRQGDMVQGLFAASAAAGALGSLWAAGRPDSYS